MHRTFKYSHSSDPYAYRYAGPRLANATTLGIRSSEILSRVYLKIRHLHPSDTDPRLLSTS